ncbi:prohead core protein [Klebsiella phage EI]|nr:prohead core protein [Klebsiella phage EI]
MLKELLMTEAQTIDAKVELDSIFESVELSADVKAKFETVYETAVKAAAVKLAESHIEKIATLAEEKVEEEKEKAEKKITESAAKFLDHVAKEWLAENKLAVDRGIKADLFESMVVGLKDLFVEHNVVVPEDAVDVVAELQEEIAEQKAETARLFEEVNMRDAYINYVQRETAMNEATRDLTESQKEKVISLTEGLEYSDAFGTKLAAIVEMVQSSAEASAIVESADINTIDKDAEGLNFTVEAVEPEETPKQSGGLMAAYVASAARIS